MYAGTRFDTRLCGCKAHGGPEAREIALEARRLTAIRRMVNPDDTLRRRVVLADSASGPLLLAPGRPVRVDQAPSAYHGH